VIRSGFDDLSLPQQFTQTDPLALGVGSSFESAYVYGFSNPALFVDPTGERAGFFGAVNVLAAGPTTTKKPALTYAASAPYVGFLKTWEGVVTDKKGVKYYNDSKGFCTTGYGHLVARRGCTKAELAKRISLSQAEQLLRSDIGVRVSGFVSALVEAGLTNSEITQQWGDALFDVNFNRDLRSSKTYVLLKSKDLNAVLSLWKKTSLEVQSDGAGIAYRWGDRVGIAERGDYSASCFRRDEGGCPNLKKFNGGK
jgi:GH24 family phage-related lysozyme (muramidase)